MPLCKNPCPVDHKIYDLVSSPMVIITIYLLSAFMPRNREEDFKKKKYINLKLFTPKLSPRGGVTLSVICNFFYSLPYGCYTPILVKFGPVVLRKKM